MRRNFHISANELFCFSLYVFVIYALFPLVRSLPMGIRALFRGLPELMLIVVILLKKDAKLFINYIWVTIAAVFIAIVRSSVWANGIEESVFANCLSSVLYWHCITQGYYVCRFLDGDKAKKILRMAVGMISFSSLTTILGNLIWSEATRDATGIYYKYNVGAYSFVYCLAFVLPWVLYARENKGLLPQSKKFLTVVAVEILVCIFVGQYMTALLVALMSVLVIGKRKSIKKTIGVFALLLVLIILLYQPMLMLLNAVSVWVGNAGFASLEERIHGMYILLKGSKIYGDVGARVHLYSISLRHFFENPMLGLFAKTATSRSPYYKTSQLLNMSIESVNAVGQHSDIIDLLGGGGLVAFIPFLALLASHAKRFFSGVSDKPLKHAFFVVMIQYVAYGIFDHSFSCFDVALAVFLVPMLVRKVRLDSAEKV